MTESPVRKLVKLRLKIDDDRAERLAGTQIHFPDAAGSAVRELLADREALLEALDVLFDRYEICKEQRDEAHEIASEKHQRTVAKLRGKLANVTHLARLFLMWFEDDGEPVDGFRFRETWKALHDAVGQAEWEAKLKGKRTKGKVKK